ncbi:hypothetical protein DDQ68_01450 [Hymenobacter nivis]|uniref:DUF4382 domain-containing protein n=1 Tax=Hymenobacter nivis TaxID=1850093 RepID=A0A2Z3GSE0_9BACT|nr:hypothetical protein DDQ68_01450 [Hymenobacter nivis]
MKPQLIKVKLSCFFIVLLALALGAGSCKKLLNLLHFTVSDASSFTVPAAATATGAVVALPGLTVSSTSSSTYTNNKTSSDYVQDVTLDQLTLTTTSPATQNFDFLKSVSISIASDAAGTNKTLLAKLDAVPTGQTTIILQPVGNKLDLYLRGNSYTLFTTVTVAQVLRQNTTIRADTRFNVTATLPE